MVPSCRRIADSGALNLWNWAARRPRDTALGHAIFRFLQPSVSERRLRSGQVLAVPELHQLCLSIIPFFSAYRNRLF